MNGTIREALKESIHLHLAGGDPVGIDRIVAQARQLHPDVFEQYGEALALKGASTMVKHLLREATEISQDQEDQLYLPGMDAPLAIAFEQEGEYKYVATLKAKWPHLEKALVERELNIERAIAQRDDWELKLDYLRPVMENDPGITLEQAALRLREARERVH